VKIYNVYVYNHDLHLCVCNNRIYIYNHDLQLAEALRRSLVDIGGGGRGGEGKGREEEGD